MPFPFKEKSGQFKDYKRFEILEGAVSRCIFYAKDEKDAELYIEKVKEIDAKNKSPR